MSRDHTDIVLPANGLPADVSIADCDDHADRSGHVQEAAGLPAAHWTSWKCRHCGHVNRGTDSSLFCESCGTPRG
jgi:rubrerythrin